MTFFLNNFLLSQGFEWFSKTMLQKRFISEGAGGVMTTLTKHFKIVINSIALPYCGIDFFCWFSLKSMSKSNDFLHYSDEICFLSGFFNMYIFEKFWKNMFFSNIVINGNFLIFFVISEMTVTYGEFDSKMFDFMIFIQ